MFPNFVTAIRIDQTISKSNVSPSEKYDRLDLPVALWYKKSSQRKHVDVVGVSGLLCRSDVLVWGSATVIGALVPTVEYNSPLLFGNQSEKYWVR